MVIVPPVAVGFWTLDGASPLAVVLLIGGGWESERSGEGRRRRMLRSSREASAEDSFCVRADIFPCSISRESILVRS